MEHRQLVAGAQYSRNSTGKRLRGEFCGNNFLPSYHTLAQAQATAPPDAALSGKIGP